MKYDMNFKTILKMETVFSLEMLVSTSLHDLTIQEEQHRYNLSYCQLIKWHRASLGWSLGCFCIQDLGALWNTYVTDFEISLCRSTWPLSGHGNISTKIKINLRWFTREILNWNTLHAFKGDRVKLFAVNNRIKIMICTRQGVNTDLPIFRSKLSG